jgi:hypothetical protein
VALSDASPDAPEDQWGPDLVDGADCVQAQEPVWQSTDTGFTYLGQRQEGVAFEAGGCVSVRSEYDFALFGGVGTLTEKACGYAGPVNRSATLTADQTAQVVAALNALHTVCGTTSCGAGTAAPQPLEITLTIGTTTYNGDFYAGCGAAPPYLSSDALTGLANIADNLLSTACPPNGGTAGTCTTGAADGG